MFIIIIIIIITHIVTYLLTHCGPTRGCPYAIPLSQSGYKTAITHDLR